MTNGRMARVWDMLRTQLWPLPAAAVVVAVILGGALPALDAAVDDQLPEGVAVLLFSGGPEAARAVLQTIAGSLITVTSLTFSLTVVTLQLASGQFSPRLLRTFTSDGFVHATLALFLATFAFALAVLRSVRTESSQGPSFVPELSVTVAYALAIASIMSLVLFLAHLTREIRVETMMRRVTGETRDSMDRVFPAGRPAPPPEPTAESGGVRILCSHSGFLTAANKKALLQAAVEADAVIRVDREPGSSLIEGTPFATAWPLAPKPALPPEASDQLREKINAAVETNSERTNVQDVGYGFRQLADVAARALSPGINDPTTAMHVLGHLSGLLCRLADRNPGPDLLADDDGTVRVILAQPGFGDLLELAVGQVRLYGIRDPAVVGRLLFLLQEVSWCDKNGLYRHQIREQLERLRGAIDAGTYLPAERSRLTDLADAVENSPNL
ncbi:DUF2254 domain-containing protein [Pseudarthrobacter sp. AB1]|uniref:DUF2254 domain-containing protein n=1 Tax=Pseudarthrobacter sp. AB1 TaxID=2138309 RepID=UPI00186B7305|nr:DUF2254 domain-containing protein [Pseudarthrobacter sp. AB1]MBE4720319.1 DUF2254 domain-containing protein [Pseudarthrobacter sp. AB1]